MSRSGGGTAIGEGGGGIRAAGMFMESVISL